jgi:AcrR family transcriptional regulator
VTRVVVAQATEQVTVAPVDERVERHEIDLRYCHLTSLPPNIEAVCKCDVTFTYVPRSVKLRVVSLLADTPARGNARGRRSRQRLLDAAAECFGETGYSQTRISDITAAAGLSQGAFYRHFKDKTEILLEALRDPLDELMSAIVLDAARAPDEAELVRSTTEFFRVYAAHRRVFRVIREAAALHEPGLTELWLDVRGRYLDRIEAWLHALVRDGHVELDDVRVTAEALGAVLDQMAYTRFGVRPVDVQPEEIAALGRVTGRVWYRTLA